MVAAMLSCYSPTTTVFTPINSTPSTFAHRKLSEAKVEYDRCSLSIASVTCEFGYNITAEDTAAQQWHFLDSSMAKTRVRFRGEISVNRGSLFQVSDIEVRIVVTSNKENGLMNVHLQSSNSSLEINYFITDEGDIYTDAQILIFLRPWPKRLLDVLDIRSEVLDITFNDMLNWHVSNLFVHTSYGQSWYNSTYGADPLIVQNTTVSSYNGYIFGYYAAHGNLTFQNVHGQIGVILIPVNGRPSKLDSISASTLSATIHVEVEYGFTNWPTQPHTHVTNIHTRHGELYAFIPHGSYTNLSSTCSWLFARLQPFGNPNPEDLNEIYTYSELGWKTRVRIDDAILDGSEDLNNPLLNTISKHYLGEGSLWLRYPYSWFGSVEAQIDHGRLEFDATELEDFEKSEGYVKARRGKKGDSRLDIQVGTGAMDVHLGLD
ncbi:hypothetical protein N0V83_008223 [Neocucurbitaria cava]|uniref:Uncharacterized protein n=1 Tax=Neocucurbitaria cava TaxID=798079 RepID=A0A9W9CJI5_9PLEO|nr:hypothetical protein N0V83_008223 [Neocucurbitaria cava]